MNNNLRISAFNFDIEIQEDFREYILNILQQQFDHYETIESVVISLKTLCNKFPADNYLTSRFFFPNMGKISKMFSSYSKLSAYFKTTFLKDDEKFFGFYKNALTADKSVLVVTKTHNSIYKSIENKIKGCVVIDFETIENYQMISNKDVSRIPDNSFTTTIQDIAKKIEETNKGLVNYNKVQEINDSINSLLIESEIKNYDIFERLFLIPKDDNWTTIIFPYYFLSKFIGVIGVSFKGSFDVNKLENYINFLYGAKHTFYRGIVKHIADDWCEKKGSAKFIDLLKYFINVKVIEDAPLNQLEAFWNKEQTDYSIFLPLIRRSNKKTMPLILKENGKDIVVVEIDKEVEGNEEEIKKFTFEIISHIQWLWEYWQNKK